MDIFGLLLLALVIYLLLSRAKVRHQLALANAKFDDVVDALQRGHIGPIPHHRYDQVARSPWWRTWYKV